MNTALVYRLPNTIISMIGSSQPRVLCEADLPKLGVLGRNKENRAMKHNLHRTYRLMVRIKRCGMLRETVKSGSWFRPTFRI